MKGEENIMARLRPGCICTGIRLYRILEAIDGGAENFEEIARRTGIGAGECGGKRCRTRVAEILRDRENRSR
jgi:bacterioferritin-associated ferredoxin